MLSGHIRLEDTGGCEKKSQEGGDFNSDSLCEAHGVLPVRKTFHAVTAAKRSRISSFLWIGNIEKESAILG